MKAYLRNNVPVGRKVRPSIKLLLEVFGEATAAAPRKYKNYEVNLMYSTQDEDARFWFIEGECDAIAMLSPQYPDNIYYMMGFRDAKHRLATGEICWRWNDQQEFLPVELDNLKIAVDDLRF